MNRGLALQQLRDRTQRKLQRPGHRKEKTKAACVCVCVCVHACISIGEKAGMGEGTPMCVMARGRERLVEPGAPGKSGYGVPAGGPARSSRGVVRGGRSDEVMGEGLDPEIRTVRVALE